MGKRFGTDYEGRRIEVEPSGAWSGTTVRLLVDGEEAAQAKGSKRVDVTADDLQVRTWLAWHGESFKRAELVVDGDAARPIPLDPPPGTLAARREAFARRHPALYASHHAAAGVAKVLLGLIGIGFLLRLLPDISIDLPLPSIDIPWPPFDLPDLPDLLPDLPDLPPLPGWVRAILESAKYWGPILAGVAYAIVEYRRRRRHRRPSEQHAPGA